MNRTRMTTVFSVEERERLKLEMIRILDKYSKEEVEIALQKLIKTASSK